MENIERMIRKDIKTMKRIGSNIRHQKGKRGLGAGNFNPLRGMTQKQIAKLHGETRVYDMTKILPVAEFRELDDTMKKLHLESWRARFETREIVEKMGIAQPTYYKYCKKLGVTGGDIPRKKYARKAREKGGDEMTAIIELDTKACQKTAEEIIEDTVKKVEEEPKKETTQKQVASLLTLNESISGERLATRLRAIAELVNDDETYTINMSIER